MKLENVNLKITNRDQITLTFDNCTFWQLHQMFEEISNLSQTRLSDHQTFLHFALGDKIKERPDMVDGYLNAMNFTDTAIRVLTENNNLSNDLWQMFENAKEKLD